MSVDGLVLVVASLLYWLLPTYNSHSDIAFAFTNISHLRGRGGGGISLPPMHSISIALNQGIAMELEHNWFVELNGAIRCHRTEYRTAMLGKVKKKHTHTLFNFVPWFNPHQNDTEFKKKNTQKQQHMGKKPSKKLSYKINRIKIIVKTHTQNSLNFACLLCN